MEHWSHLSRCGRWLIGAIVVSALALWSPADALAGPFAFSLDNRPQAPISIDPLVIGGGNGSEDPFGLVPAPTLVGPSPSLNTFSVPLGRTLSDADILVPGVSAPQVNTATPFGTNYVDAISTNQAGVDGNRLRLAFSVDRASVGVASSAVHDQFLLNQHPGDIFLSDRDFPDPGQFVGLPINAAWVGNLSSAGVGGSNLLLINQSTLKLKAGELLPGDFTESTELAPPIAPGTHDNVDAFDISLPDTSGDLIADKSVYFSVNPDQPGLHPLYGGGSAAHLYRTQAGSQFPTLFAQANTMGLDNLGVVNGDDVDALIVFDLGAVGVLNPGIDYALFSLSPGSQALHLHGLTAADMFFTDFNGSFATYATDADLGLEGTVNPAELGGGGSGLATSSGTGGVDNLDGLGSYPLGDMDWSGTLNGDDVDDFVQGLTRPDDYRDVNLEHFGQPATILGDFSVPRDGLVDFDDIPPFRMAIEEVGGGAGLVNQGVPEPGTVRLASAMLIVLGSVRRVRRGAMKRRTMLSRN